MKAVDRREYPKPAVRTYEAKAILSALGPVSAGSSQPCGPMLENYCP